MAVTALEQGPAVPVPPGDLIAISAIAIGLLLFSILMLRGNVSDEAHRMRLRSLGMIALVLILPVEYVLRGRVNAWVDVVVAFVLLVTGIVLTHLGDPERSARRRRRQR